MTTLKTGDGAAPSSGGESDVLLRVRDLQVHFPIKRGLIFDRTVGHVRAVDGVSLDVRRGETYGLVGESGCGKSTLGRAILRLEEPTGGSVHLDGVPLDSLKGEQLRRARRTMQMVFQDPMASLDPRQSVESLLTEPLRAHAGADGVAPAKQWRDQVMTMLDVVGLPASAASKYPHEFSGGQRQRLGIARAMVLRPSLVIAHDLAVVRHISDTIGVMYLGRLVEEAPSDALYAEPGHPYTISLMSAIPIPDPEVEDRRERILLSGDLPSPANPPSGCRFHTRCPFRQPTRCHDEVPELVEVAVGHRVACHYARQVRSGELTPRASAAVSSESVADAGEVGKPAREPHSS